MLNKSCMGGGGGYVGVGEWVVYSVDVCVVYKYAQSFRYDQPVDLQSVVNHEGADPGTSWNDCYTSQPATEPPRLPTSIRTSQTNYKGSQNPI